MDYWFPTQVPKRAGAIRSDPFYPDPVRVASPTPEMQQTLNKRQLDKAIDI